MQDLLEELYLGETGKTLFYLDLNVFPPILRRNSWGKLQQAFETQQHSLSQSFLIWTEPSGEQWILADFGNKKTYRIEPALYSDVPRTAVSELPDLNPQLKDPQTVCKLLLEDSQTGRSVLHP